MIGTAIRSRPSPAKECPGQTSGRVRSPYSRTSQVRPRTGRATTPSDVSALAGNDYQDRMPARALRVINTGCQALASAKRPGQPSPERS
jgi:hypothetical protein